MFKENLKYIIPSFGSVLIALGILRQVYYYYLFEIDIIPYLEISEILMLFSKEIGIFIIFIIIVFLFSFFITKKENTEISNDRKENYYYETNIIDRLIYIIKNSLLSFSIFLLLFLKYINSYEEFTSNWEINHFLIVCSSAFFFEFLFNEIRRHYKNIYKKQISPLLIGIPFLISLFLIMTIGGAYIDYKNVTEKNINSGSEIKLKDRSIISSNDFYYIGQTRNYIFFYNEKNREKSILKMSDVKEINLKNRRE